MLFLKHSSHFSSIEVTPSVLRQCRIVCAACGTVWSGLREEVCSRWLCGVCVCVLALCVLRVGQCAAGLGRECAAGGFVVCLCVGIVCAACGTVWSGFVGGSVQQVALWCVCVFRYHLRCCKRIKTSAVLRTIHLYHGGISGYCNLRR